MIPIRGPIPKPTAPTAPPGLTKGMAKIATDRGGRRDLRTSNPPDRVQGVGAWNPYNQGQVPGVPQIGFVKDQRARLVQFLKSQRKPQGIDALVLQALQGGGRPQGPAYKGYLTQLLRTLLGGA